MATERVLVTGGAGFIGTHLCRSLIASGRKVTCLDLRLPAEPIDGVAYVQGDVRDPILLERLVSDAEAVVHLAATVSVPLCQTNPTESYSNNFGATLILLEALRAQKSRGRTVGLVFASSAAVYGDLGDDGRALGEDAVAPRFSSFYAAQKHASEEAIELHAVYFGIPGAIFRFFNVFGPGQDPKSPYSGVITVFSNLAASGAPLALNGGGKQTRDFISVHDIVDAIGAMLARPFDRWTADPINLGSGRSVTVREVAETISRIRGGKSVLIDAPPREGDVLHSRADISRAQASLGFVPRVSLEEGLRSLLDPAGEPPPVCLLPAVLPAGGLSDSRRRIERAIDFLSRGARWMALAAIAVLGARAALRLESRWDAFMYHLPFAAKRAGLPLPYDMNDEFQAWYEGFPPLAEFVQGWLWRLSGTMNATGIPGWLAFVGFLAACQRFLRASFWMTALIALIAPMVIIHSATNYVDLFGNSFLALAAAATACLAIFPERSGRAVLGLGLVGVAGAFWTKFLLVPPAGFVYLLIAGLVVARRRTGGYSRRQAIALVLGAGMVAAIPYAKNLATWGNPFWPVRVPVVGARFPYLIDGEELGKRNNRPPPLQNAGRLELFARSLLEIHHPTRYPDHPRWSIDQGSNYVAFRMGGFWVWNVILCLGATLALLVRFRGKRGAAVGCGLIALILVAGCVPQSHELRYFLFIPLTWAAMIAMLFPELRARAPGAALGLLGILVAMFLYMAWENREHYRVYRFQYADAARFYGFDRYWTRMTPGEPYCAINMLPAAMTLTGPTRSEFRIYDRSGVERCPENSRLIDFSGPLPGRGEAKSQDDLRAQDLVNQAIAVYRRGEYRAAAGLSKLAVRFNPRSAFAYNNLCTSYNQLQRWDDAIAACRKALEIDPAFQMAANNLAWAVSHR